jgi:hypothetical protein
VRPILAASIPSDKHLFLAARLGSLMPDSEPRIVHRVYRIDRERTKEVFGQRIAEIVPSSDGFSDLPLFCGPGRDFLSGGDPDAEKRRLETEHCDPDLRELFIAALAGETRR